MVQIDTHIFDAMTRAVERFSLRPPPSVGLDFAAPRERESAPPRARSITERGMGPIGDRSLPEPSFAHFIAPSQRPDLRCGALRAEPDLIAESAALARQAEHDKLDKDLKDVEKLCER